MIWQNTAAAAYVKLQIPDHTGDEAHEVKFKGKYSVVTNYTLYTEWRNIEHFMLATLKSELISILKYVNNHWMYCIVNDAHTEKSSQIGNGILFTITSLFM